MTFKEATFEDYERIARLHALSWKRTYRGLISDDYLDNQVDEERLEAWRERMSTPDPTRLVLMAEEGEQLMGFVCIFSDYDPVFGAFIDNLHAHPDHKRGGIGLQLIQRAAAWACERHPHTPLYLWVLEGNHNARGFYEHIGAISHERVVRNSPYAQNSSEIRCVWPDAQVLVD
ncbi:MAG: GNAT family N-acetyltransferase, partial [Spirosomaceae bacterium]|nr:GNAT family N-acetyltransferase [Spirosomataceae bacterium]